MGFKFSVTRESGVKVVVKSNDEDLGFENLVALFEDFAIAAGYGQETIDQYLTEPTATK